MSREPDFLANVRLTALAFAHSRVKIPSSFTNVVKLATHNGKTLNV